MPRRRSRSLQAVLALGILLAVGFGTLRVVEARQQETPKGATSVAQPSEPDVSVSVHGSDQSTVDSSGTSFITCDLERDGNPVRGVYDFDTATSGGDGAMEDLDGAGGRCARIETPQAIVRHRTCERNHVTWDCDNWVDGAAP